MIDILSILYKTQKGSFSISSEIPFFLFDYLFNDSAFSTCCCFALLYSEQGFFTEK